MTTTIRDQAIAHIVAALDDPALRRLPIHGISRVIFAEIDPATALGAYIAALTPRQRTRIEHDAGTIRLVSVTGQGRLPSRGRPRRYWAVTPKDGA
jgi:hypothetical protein